MTTKHYKIGVVSILFFTIFIFSFNGKQATDPYDNYPVYAGKDLGVHYTPKQTVFKIWSPNASEVTLELYKSGNKDSAFNTIKMAKSDQGTWQVSVKRDIRNCYYTFQVKHDGKWLEKSPDIYAKAVGVNGKRGMVVDMTDTDPLNWSKDKRPLLKSPTDIILYETHIRDFSIDSNSGITHKGKYLGMVEKGTRGPKGASTGLDHLKELGITHVHLLPSFDFNSIDETKPALNIYNWGYDPLNYNVPEGSYSTNPFDGKVRIKEFKQMVQSFHTNGIRVIMDVVYNHTANLQAAFNQFAPGYYYRHNANGTYSDATGCGNETASERAMMKKFIIESVAYWATEYHIDGFRFDLMGVHDITTMNRVSDTLHKIDPTIFIYGEGWTAGSSPLPEDQRAIKKNTYLLNNIAAFSDDIRDALRGPFSNSKEKGFVSGAKGNLESVKFGIIASTQHPQINYQEVHYSKLPWARQPSQAINYVSCHDDPTLFDRLTEANPGSSKEELIKMDKLAQTVVFTSQGVAFIQSGAEMLRTKQGVHNSYKSPDSINEIDWSRKIRYKRVFDYYKGLITLRKNHPSFRMPSTEMIQDNLRFIDTSDPLFIAFRLANVDGDKWNDILVLLNGDKTSKSFQLPDGDWILSGDGNTINEKGIRKVTGTVEVPRTTAFILHKLY